MTVRDALALINQILDEYGFGEGEFGRAETLTKAKKTDSRLTCWEMVHHLTRILETEGEEGAARIVRALGGAAETARELCYRLYALADRKNRAAEALAYNTLVSSWPAIAERERSMDPAQVDLLGPVDSRI